MLKYQLAILELEKQWNLWRSNPHVPPGGMFININTMQAGASLTSVPDSAEATGSLLFNPDFSGEVVMAEIRATIDRVTAADYWLRDHPPVLDLPLDSASSAPWIKEPVNLSHDHPGVGDNPGAGCACGVAVGIGMRVGTGWNVAVALGRGVAFATRGDTVVATVAHVAVDTATGKVRVVRLTCAHDCGSIVNPRSLTGTIEANLMQSMSRALYEPVAFDSTTVTSASASTYEVRACGSSVSSGTMSSATSCQVCVGRTPTTRPG